MSRLGKKPIEIPAGVEVSLKDNTLHFKGKEGTLELPVLPGIHVEIQDSGVVLSAQNDEQQTRANWGTCAALVRNSLIGVAQKWSKKLIVEGVGYRVSMDGPNLILNVGYSHPVKFELAEGISITTEKNNVIISGIDKIIVGQTAAHIRKIRKPEPYKGKGIRYSDEVVRRKAGKKAGA